MKAIARKNLYLPALLAAALFLHGCATTTQRLTADNTAIDLNVCKQKVVTLYSNQETVRRPPMIGLCIQY